MSRFEAAPAVSNLVFLYENILSERTVPNRREDLLCLAKENRGALFALEVGTHSPWLSRLIEHGSEERQLDRLAITLRDSLVRQRVNIISKIGFSLKSLGVRLPGCSTPYFAKLCRRELVDSPLLTVVEAPLAALDGLNEQIKALDKQVAKTAAEQYPQTKLLEQITGVGPITSLSYLLAVGEPERFKDPRDVAAYLGLVPRHDQSGQSDKQLPISKAANRDARRLLVQSAQYILGHFGPDCDLRRHGLKLAARGGKAAK